jgi:hypothetical protein
MGRALKLHSNPRRPAENRIQAWAPSFNRAVLFETNEHSWHGFPTRDRPAGELAPVHGTFYVHRPLPARFREGYTLTEADEEELLFQMDRRDRWIQKCQRTELDKAGELARQGAYIQELLARVRAPLAGYVLQDGGSQGLYADGWVAPQVEIRVRPLQPVRGFGTFAAGVPNPRPLKSRPPGRPRRRPQPGLRAHRSPSRALISNAQ